RGAGWGARGGGVTLPPRQFKQSNLVERVLEALEHTGLEPRFLDLELTENMVLNSSPPTVETLQQLCSMGIRISIDDFGTGYSSLKYLRRFPRHMHHHLEALGHDIDNRPVGAAIRASRLPLVR